VFYCLQTGKKKTLSRPNDRAHSNCSWILRQCNYDSFFSLKYLNSTTLEKYLLTAFCVLSAFFMLFTRHQHTVPLLYNSVQTNFLTNSEYVFSWMKNCLLGISPASEHYKPTFRNSVSVPSSAGGEVWGQVGFWLYIYGKRSSSGWWSGPIRGGDGVSGSRGSGSKK